MCILGEQGLQHTDRNHLQGMREVPDPSYIRSRSHLLLRLIGLVRPQSHYGEVVRPEV